MTLKALYNLTPDKVKRMTVRELDELIEAITVIVTDYQVVKDLITDRNDYRLCYDKLRIQIQDLGVEPCINYYNLHNRRN